MPVLVAFIALGIVQLSLQVIAVMDLARRPVVTGGRKWVWIVVAVLGGLLGAAAYLAFGRAAPPMNGKETAAGNEAARRRALDTLYGPDKR